MRATCVRSSVFSSAFVAALRQSVTAAPRTRRSGHITHRNGFHTKCDRGIHQVAMAGEKDPLPVPTTTHISAKQAAEIDVKLMGPEYGFTLDQLMELAGLSVAAATFEAYPPTTHPSVLIIAGPGNNGGDGLVAARHLAHFGYQDVQVCYPKRSAREPIYGNLVKQLETSGDAVQFVHVDEVLQKTTDVVIDAMFGFSFSGEPRAPFDEILAIIKDPANEPPPTLSIDVPSGWDVDQGDTTGSGLRPETLVSLTAPKLFAKHYKFKNHFVGSRFLPPKLVAEYGLTLPKYKNAEQIARVY